jgi:LacI family transcriptional regulator
LAKSHVTAADIALHLGLGKSTVAHVLNGRAERLRIRPETRRRVEEAAREMGYRPNVSARAMRTGRFGAAALIQPLSGVYLPVELLIGLADALRAHDMHLSVAEAPNEVLHDEGYLPKVVRELAADGLLINMIADASTAFIKAVEAHHIPSIWINSEREADCVHPDDFMGGRIATEHLLGLGHRRIAFVQEGPPRQIPLFKEEAPAESGGQHYSVRDRRHGYEQAMHAAGLTPQAVALSGRPWSYDETLDDRRIPDAVAFLSGPERPTAIVAYESSPALPLLYAALSLGLRVPEDLSLVMFHGGLEQNVGIPITTVDTNISRVGREAVRMLLQKIAHPDEPLPRTAVPPRFFAGTTCGPPPPRP